MCAQPGGGSEDCLFLNVFSTNLSPKKLAPVMVYIHGGGLMYGSGNADKEITSNLTAQTDVVTVTLNYRLNVFGFLALSELTKECPWDTSGNYGFYDQIMALKWVQENIENFGGDPDCVTIFGQSSGGTSVLALVASPLAKGLFDRAIAMSSSVIIDMPLEQAEKANVGDFVNNTRCQGFSGNMLLECLYGLDMQEVLSGLTGYWNGPYDMGIPARDEQRKQLAIVDGYLLPDSLDEILASGEVNDVPLIFGVMHEEVDIAPLDVVVNMSRQQYQAFIMQKFSLWGSGFGDQVLAAYPIDNYDTTQHSYDVIATDIRVTCGNLMNAQLAATSFSSPVYFYLSTQYPANPICFLPNYCSRYAFHTWDIRALNDHINDAYNLTKTDYPYRNLLQHYFVEFATNGYLTDWKPFDSVESFPNDYVVKILAAPGDMDDVSVKHRECSS
jgi:para-nitrobenzyl esterase